VQVLDFVLSLLLLQYHTIAPSHPGTTWLCIGLLQPSTWNLETITNYLLNCVPN